MKLVCQLITVCLCLLVGTTMAVAKDVPEMYSSETLDHWKGILEPWVNQLIKQEIEPNLSPMAKQAFLKTKIKVEVPTKSGSNDPFYYQFKGHSLIAPVLSVKFLYDLVAAHLWLEAHGFEDASLLYVSALKYQDASAFPKGHYLPPFDALGVSHNKYMELTNNEPDTGPAFQRLFNGALLFLLAHETAHAILPPKQQTAMKREVEADLFAFNILARSQFDPAGLTWLFTYLSVWLENAADFPTPQDYLHSIERASHPFTGNRLATVGIQLVRYPHDFFPGVPDSDERISSIKLIGSRLIEMGKNLDDFASRREWGDVARDIKIESLAIHKISAGQASEASNDFVKLSARWWGTPVEEFPIVAGLSYGEYSQGDDPSKLTSNKIIVVDSIKVKGKWTPVELPPYSFTFSQEEGLIEISGFLTGLMDSVLTALEARYGKYNREISALGFKTYVWNFDKTVLEVSSNSGKAFIYKMFPRTN